MVFLQTTLSCQSHVLNCCTLDMCFTFTFVLFAIQTYRLPYVSKLGMLFWYKIVWMFLVMSSVHCPSDTSIWLGRELIFAAFYFAGTIFLRIEVNPQNPHAKIKKRKIFNVLHGMTPFIFIICFQVLFQTSRWPVYSSQARVRDWRMRKRLLQMQVAATTKLPTPWKHLGKFQRSLSSTVPLDYLVLHYYA